MDIKRASLPVTAALTLAASLLYADGFSPSVLVTGLKKFTGIIMGTTVAAPDRDVTLYNPAYFVPTPTPGPPTIVNLYLSPTGDDTTGQGTLALPYLTPTRACRDVPPNFTASVHINMAAGTYTGTTWFCDVKPGSTGKIRLIGAVTAAETWTSVASPTAVSGKRAQWTQAVAAFATTITDGSHWLYWTPATGTGAGIPNVLVSPLASVSPNLITNTHSLGAGFFQGALNTNIGASTPLKLSPFNVTVTGTSAVRGFMSGTPGTSTVEVYGIKFTGSHTGTFAEYRGCSFTGSQGTFNNGTLTAVFASTATPVVVNGTTINDSSFNNVLWAPGLWQNVSNSFPSPVNMRGVIFKNGITSSPGSCKLCIGGSGFFSSLFSIPLGEEVSATDCDFQQSSGNILVHGTNASFSSGSGVTGARNTVVVTGSLMTVEDGGTFMHHGLSITATPFEGTVTAPIVIKTGGHAIGLSSQLLTNTLNSGQDVAINGAPAIAFASAPATFEAHDVSTTLIGSTGTASRNVTLYDPRFFTTLDATTPVNLYVATTGSDTTGDGTSGNPYLSVNRACQDIPDYFSQNVHVNVAAGTYTDTRIDCPAIPRSTNLIRVIGAVTALETWTSVGAGSNLSGRVSKFTSTVAAFGTTITEGTHYLTWTTTTGTVNGLLPLSSSATPQLDYIARLSTSLSGAISGSAPLKLSAWNTIFSGSVTARGPNVLGQVLNPTSPLQFIGIKFTGTTETFLGVNVIACHFSGTTARLSNALGPTSSYFSAKAGLDNVRLATNEFNGTAVSVVHGGYTQLIDSNLFKGAAGGFACKLCLGGVTTESSSLLSNNAISNFVTNNDFEQSAGNIQVSGAGSSISFANTNTVNVTGSALTVTDHGQVYATGGAVISGGVTSPIVVSNGGSIDGISAFTLVNSNVAGQDVAIDGAAAVTFASLPAYFGSLGVATADKLTVITTATLPASSITASNITDVPRYLPIPIHAWAPCTGQGIWTVDNATGAEPNLTAVNTGLAIVYDIDAAHIDTETICASFTVPVDYASGGAMRAVAIGGVTAQVETFSCQVSQNGGALGSANAANLAASASVQVVTSTPVVTYAAGDAIAFVCKQGNAAADDVVKFLSTAWTYTATQ